MEERKRMGKKWIPTSYPTLHKMSLLVWNWNHSAHHAFEFVTVELKFGSGNMVDKLMELRFVWTYSICNYFMDWCAGGNWSNSQLDMWAFLMSHLWRDSFYHFGRALPYGHQLPQLPILSDFGILPGWDNANVTHPTHHWGPAHFSNFSNQGFWDFAFGTGTIYGYGVGQWNGTYLNDIKQLNSMGLRFHNYGLDNAKREAKWAARGANYEDLEDGTLRNTDKNGDYPAATMDKQTIVSSSIQERTESYKLPLLV